MGAGCKPAGFCLRWFESNTLHQYWPGAGWPRVMAGRMPSVRRAQRRMPTSQFERLMLRTSSPAALWSAVLLSELSARGPVSVAVTGVRGGGALFRVSAGVAQLVERQFSKLNVASSILVSRSLLSGSRAPQPANGLLSGSRAPQPANGLLSGSRAPQPANGLLSGSRAPQPANGLLSGSRAPQPANGLFISRGRPNPRGFSVPLVGRLSWRVDSRALR